MTTTPSVPDGDEARVLAEVADVCREVHGSAGPRISLDSDLVADLGLDSLALVDLADRLAGAFGVVLEPEVVAASTTPRRLARAVRQGVAESAGARQGRPSPLPPEPAVAERHEGGPRSTLWPTDVTTVNEALARHAAERPDQVTVRLVGSGSATPPDELTYGALYREALVLGRGLLAGGLAFGDRVGLMLPTERSYFSVYCGVLLAGGVPVPLYPPARAATLEAHLERQGRLLDNAGASVLVTVAEALPAARLVQVRVPALRAVRTADGLVRQAAAHEPLPEVTAADLGLVQYTSGSTGDPKGVVLTQGQLLANMAAMGEAAAVTPDDVVVSWLPLYHDMGLIGLWLTPLVLGIPMVAMSPLTFLARPSSWLEAISRYRGTISAAPNFAYQACADRVSDDELAGLDLSSWRLAFNGSEQVSTTTIEAFADRFGTAGFRREAMCPAYGLAEAGVGVAFSPPGRGPRVDTVSRSVLAGSGRAVAVEPDDPAARSIVGCGYPLPGYEVRVTGPRGSEVPDRHEGRVEFRGPSATAGYYANEAATRALWHRGWLDTGDLGYTVGGELFLTGRSKDLVIRGGRNLHPEELEEALGTLPGLRPDGVAVFSSPDPRRATERLVVVAEATARSPEQRGAIEDRVRRRTMELLRFPPEVISLVPPGAIRRTASGKIRRGATREAFEAGVLGRRPSSVPLQLARLTVRDVAPAGRRAARAASEWCFALASWLLVVLLGGPLWVAVHLPIRLESRWRLTRRSGWLLAKLAGVPVRAEGSLPGPGVPAVIVANHASFVDALVLVLASPDPLVFVTSTELGRAPVIGSFVRRLGCLLVARGAPGQAPGEVAALAGVVRRGGRPVFFPEGSIARGRGVRPFHLGAFAVAAATGAALVPVAIRGTGGVLRPGSFLPRAGEVRVLVDRPLEPPGTALADEAASAESVRRRIALLAGEPLTGSAR